MTGECETSYWVKPAITPDGQPLMDIMKVRNYDRCLNRVFFMWDMFNGKTCDYCEPNMVRVLIFIVMLNIFILDYILPQLYPVNQQHCSDNHLFSSRMENSVDPDQMASSEAS